MHRQLGARAGMRASRAPRLARRVGDASRVTRRRASRVARATARDGRAENDDAVAAAAAHHPASCGAVRDPCDAPFARSSALGVLLAFGLGFAVPSRAPVVVSRGTAVTATATTATTAIAEAIAEVGVDVGAEVGVDVGVDAVVDEVVIAEEMRAHDGSVVVGVAIATIVSALSAAAYVRRYEIFLALQRRLAELEANDPMYPETKESVRAQLQGEMRKRDALNEEWAERLVAEKNKSREAEKALRAEMDTVAEGVRTEKEANEQLRAQLAATENALQIEIERAQREREEIEQKSQVALSEHETELQAIEQLRAKLVAAENDLQAEIERGRLEKKEIEENSRIAMNQFEADNEANLEQLRARLAASENALQAEIERAHQIEEKSRLTLTQVEAEKEASIEQLHVKLKASESALQAEIERAGREKEEIEQKLQLAMSQGREMDALAEEYRVKLNACSNELTAARAEIQDALRANESLSDELRLSVANGRDLQARESDIERDLREEIAALHAELRSATNRASEALGQYQQLDAALPQITAAVDRLRSLSGMATEESPVIQQEFRIKDVPPMKPGEFVVVVGSWNDWNVDTGAVMTSDSSGAHVASVELSSDIVYEYKCCICTGEQRQPRLWQTGANTAFAVASSLIHSENLLLRATSCTSWVADPANSPVIMYAQDGEELILSATKLMMDLPANLIGETIEELSSLFTSAMQTFDEEIEGLKMNAR